MTGVPTDLELEDRLVSLHTLSNAARRELLGAIAELDRRKAWRTDGARSMADWLAYRLGYSHEVARDHVDAAHKLEALPLVAEAFGGGLLSWEQLCLLVRFAEPEEDAQLAREAPGWSLTMLRAKARRVSPKEAREQRRCRSLRMRWDKRDDVLRIWGRLPGADGALVEKALTRIAESAPPDPITGCLLPWERSCADALVEMASKAVGADPDPDRASLVVHVDERTLRTMHGAGELEGGIPVAVEVVRRLACDARVQAMIVREDGVPIGIGRMSRTVPHWLLRQLQLRDECCRFPGCTRKAWLHAHHIRHWGHGGRTDEDNLILLCGFHHRLVHDDGWRIKVSRGGRLRIVRPDGSTLRRRPEPLRPPSRAPAQTARSPARLN